MNGDKKQGVIGHVAHGKAHLSAAIAHAEAASGDPLRTPAERAAHWEGYQIGVLQAYEFMVESHNQDVYAADIVARLLPIGPKDLKKLKALAEREGIAVNWADIEHAWRYR